MPTTANRTREKRDNPSDPKRIARAKAMQDVLLDGLVDPVSLAHVHCRVAQQHPFLSDPELQRETIGAMMFLVRAGLVDVGYRGAGGRFVPEPLEVAMREVHGTYIAHYDQPYEWIWCCWLNLTAAGRQLARSAQVRRTGAATCRG
jgi:hypothetical protein